VTLKWAQSIDGKLAWAQQSEEQRWISNELSRKDAHKLRRCAQAILVGINTVLVDDPLLTARPSKGKKATRIVLDSFLRIPPDCQLLETAKKHPVIIYTSENAVKANLETAEKINTKGAEILTYPQNESCSNLYFLIDEISKRGVGHLLVEGGPTVLTSFLKENLADEIVAYIAPKILCGTGNAEITSAMAELTQAIDLHHVETERFGDDVRLSGLMTKTLKELSIIGG
jgi:diaminohydroxyphosphoribosylaminopyrimidine deaminase/5-amino-6-(5-phosphoribosylamino)uracil reductase